MWLIFYFVGLASFITISSATPPPGFIEQPNNDKDPPKYQYKYDVEDVNGREGQGKTETRLGELASGRYYVNGEKSSTDVKYYADEWGYHPLVKYRAANDHSIATTHFALGEHVVKSLANGSEVGEEIKLPRVKGHLDQVGRQPSYRRRRPVQIVQPYTPVSEEISASLKEKDTTSVSLKPYEIIADPLKVDSPRNNEDQRTSIKNYRQSFDNYVTLPRFSSESTESSYRLTDNKHDHRNRHDDPGLFAPTNIYGSHLSTASSLSTVGVASSEEKHSQIQDNVNDLFSTISDDVLLVENAGSFGRRLKPTASVASKENLPESKEEKQSSTLKPFEEISTSRPIFGISGTANGVVENGASSYASYSTSLTTPRPTDHVSSTLIPNDAERSIGTPVPDLHDVHNSLGAEVSSTNYRTAINEVRHRDNAVSGAYAEIFAKIYPNGERDQGIGEGVNALSNGNADLPPYKDYLKNDSWTPETEITRSPGSSTYGKRLDHQMYVTLRQSLDTEIRNLVNVHSSTATPVSTFSSKPIVVAELSNYKADGGLEYSTTFPCDNEESSTIIPSISSTLPSSFTEDSEAVLVTPKLQASHSHVTTSSVILNPIQAGVSLVNADQTELIGSQNHGDGTPAPVNERIEKESQVAEIKHFPSGHGNELSKTVMEETRSKLYGTINPSFGQSAFSNEAFGSSSIGIPETLSNLAREPVPLDGNTNDQQIEIQKSVEIYQNAPVHEIHYPPQVITQVSGINQQPAQRVKQQRQNIAGLLHQQDEEVEEMRSGYVGLQDVGNAKQFYSSLQEYNGKGEVQHESYGSQLSLDNVRDTSFIGGPVYPGNLIRQDNELVEYSMERNNGHPTILPGHENGPRIIKLIRDSIPEVKYTPAKTPRINVQVYPTELRSSNEEQSKEPSQETTDTEDQHEREKSNPAEQNKKIQSQLQKILTESGSIQRYFNGAEWTKYQAQEQRQQQQQQQQQQLQHQQQQHQTVVSSEVHGSYQVQENIDESRLRKMQQPQSIILPWTQLYDVKNLRGNFGNTVEDIASTTQTTQQIRQNIPIAERIVEKTIHVPQPYPVEVPRIIEKKVPYPVEKIVERKVPYPVEKIVEKKIPVPQPYPVHIQVPVDRIVEKQVQVLQPYPVHIEKIIEKKVPYAVQRLVPQPYPVHIIQPYPVEKIIEKPVHIPVTVEKIVEKKVHVPQPYPVQVPIKVPYPVEITKYVENTVHVPYGVRYGVSYQQIMKPQSSKGLYGNQGSMSVPLYGLSLVSNHNRDPERPNVTQEFQGYNYDKPAIPFVTGRVESSAIDQQRSNAWDQYTYGKGSSIIDNNQRHQAFAKKSYVGHSSKLPLMTYPLYNHFGTNRRHASHRQSKATIPEQSLDKDEYVGPVPSLKQNSQHPISRSHSSGDQQQQLSSKQQYSAAVAHSSSSETLTTSSRRARQQDNPPHYQSGPGAFRQSKIEYGFKPPMVPSVQYDEKTATKVEN